MQFLVKAYDGNGMLEKRMEVRPPHLEGMKALGRQIICAAGLLDDEGRMKGSALVMEFPDRAALDEYLAKEPYVAEGVWQKIEVEPINVVLVNGAPMHLWAHPRCTYLHLRMHPRHTSYQLLCTQEREIHR